MIKVIDAPCGFGKTSWAIQEIRENPDKSYVYCTPLLDEIQRIRSACGYDNVKEPIPYNGTKIDDFDELLARCENVAVTHSTFLNATANTIQNIAEGDYTLILDEVLEVVTDFNSTQTVEASPKQAIVKSDIEYLLSKNAISIDSFGKVSWLDGEQGADFKFSAVKKYADSGRLYCVNGYFLLTVFPPEIFRAFKNVYVCTYLFEGTMFDNYFRLYGIEYETVSIGRDKISHYCLLPYSDIADKGFRHKCQELISMPIEEKYLIPKGLSKSWYEKAKTEDLEQLKKLVLSYKAKYLKTAKAESIMWTCPKDNKSQLEGKGYTIIRQMTKEEKQLPEKERKQLETELSCFVPCNARATNIYRERWALMYLTNTHLKPMYIHFFQNAGGITPDSEHFALTTLIQWLCRSRLRDGKPVVLYLPSKRMREQLSGWLKGLV